MEDRIKQHFNELFAEASKTRKTLDLKQEMLQNALDKYRDLLAEGYTEEDAYQNVIHSIGDISELLAETEEKNLLTLPEADRRKRALLKAVSVGMYIFAVVVFFFCGILDELPCGRYFDYSTLGVCLAALVCIPPTGMLVYAANMYPGYVKRDKPDMVEEYKERRYTQNRNKAVRRSINTIIWTLTLVLYFAVSFLTYQWHITWIIFLIAACVQSIAGLIFSLRESE
ncbi:MAG: permease prefix domain 1-containing protein [Roseburia sp.]|nr:permease prefix domain 1-containing protein [Roseburia sp.]